MAQVGRDLGVFAATCLAHLRDTGDFGRETDTTCAGNAARHVGFDQWTQIQIGIGALRFAVATEINAIGHSLILQVAFATLVTDRAIQWVVDQQEFHDAFTRLFHHGRVRADLRRLAFGARTQITHLHGTGGSRLGRAAYNLNKAHPAVTGNRQTFVIAKTRDFDTGHFTGLNQRHRAINFDFIAVDDYLAEV